MSRSTSERHGGPAVPAVGKRTLVEQIAGPAGASPQIASPGGAGRPLPSATQARMDRSFGADFSTVRVHEGGAAAGLGAAAFTQGEDIHFAPGRFAPGTPAGDELIGHELAHVVQQRAGRVAMPQARGAAINADEALEREADQQGARAARGEIVGTHASAPRAAASAGPVQRKSLLDPFTEKGYEDKKQIEAKLMAGDTGADAYLAKALIADLGMCLDYAALADEQGEHTIDEVPPYEPTRGQLVLKKGPIATTSGDDTFLMAMTMAAILKNQYRAELREVAKVYAANQSGDEAMARLLARALTPDVKRTLLLLAGGACGDTAGKLSALYLDHQGPHQSTEEGHDPRQWRESTVMGQQRGALATKVFNPGERARNEAQLKRKQDELEQTKIAIQQLQPQLGNDPDGALKKKLQEAQTRRQELERGVEELAWTLQAPGAVAKEAELRGIRSGIGVDALVEAMSSATAPLLVQINISIAVAGTEEEHIGFNHSYVIEQQPRTSKSDELHGTIYQSYIGNHSLSKWTHDKDTAGQPLVPHLKQVQALTSLAPEAVEERNQRYKALYFLEADYSHGNFESEQAKRTKPGRLEIVWCTHPINVDVAQKNVNDLVGQTT